MRSRPSHASLLVAPLAEAWAMAGPSARDDDLITALRGERWTVALRAMLELAQRPGAKAVADVAAALRTRSWEPVFVSEGEAWGLQRNRGYSCITMAVEQDPLLAAATLLLFVAEDDRWRQPDGLQALARVLDIAPDDVARSRRSQWHSTSWATSGSRIPARYRRSAAEVDRATRVGAGKSRGHMSGHDEVGPSNCTVIRRWNRVVLATFRHRAWDVRRAGDERRLEVAAHRQGSLKSGGVMSRMTRKLRLGGSGRGRPIENP